MNALTAQQQQLVVRYMPLVEMCVRRQLRRLSRRIACREKDDIAQEGMVGLMEAASRYKPERGAPFSAYARPYIQGAICRHLVCQMDGLAVSERVVEQILRQRKLMQTSVQPGSPLLPRFYDLDASLPALADHAHMQYRRQKAAALHEPVPTELQPSLKDARQGYERSVGVAAATLKASRRSRPDRAALIDAIVQERLLVPDPQYRTPKRALARRFACSMARLLQCERRLSTLIREQLGGTSPRSASCEQVIGRSAGLAPRPVDRPAVRASRSVATGFPCQALPPAQAEDKAGPQPGRGRYPAISHGADR